LITIGIDFGATRLRAAMAIDGGEPRPVNLPPTDKFELVMTGPPRDDQPPGVAGSLRITSLKRMLDFQQAVNMPGSEQNSLDMLSGVLRELFNMCITGAGDPVVNCVVAIPPCFSQRQRSSLKAATEAAGFPRVRLVDDTLAALLATRQSIGDAAHVFVYSWGAAAFTASLYAPRPDGFGVIAQEGDRDLGGHDVDTAVAEYLLAELSKTPAKRCYRTIEDTKRLITVARQAAKTLAGNQPHRVALQGVFKTLRKPISVVVPPEIYSEFADRTFDLMAKVLDGDDMPKPDAVVLSGEMTCPGGLRDVLAEKLGMDCTATDEDAVAHGAVLFGLSKTEEEWGRAGPELSFRPADNAAAPVRAGRGAPAAPAGEQWADQYVPLLDEAQRHEGRGDIDKAIESLEKLFDQLFHRSGELYRKAAARHKEHGRLKQALGLLDKAYHRDPGNQYLAVDYAWACYEFSVQEHSHKRRESALAWIRRAITTIETVPDARKRHAGRLAEFLYRRGCLLYELGNAADAERDFKSSLQLADNEHVRDALAQIGSPRKRRFGRKKRSRPVKGSERNKPCPCGSGKKYKVCCARKR